MLSKPMIDTELEAVSDLMNEGKFSKFVGAQHPSVKEFLRMPSVDLLNLSYPIPEKTFLGGENIRKFEGAWSEFVDSKYSISVNSATSGLITALLSLPKDYRYEVITTPFSFTASAAAISLANYTPVFVDIDRDTFCLNPQKVRETITENTKAVLYVSWCGNAGYLEQIKRICQEYNLYLIEDASQSPGNTYQNKCIGTWGDIGVFSFNEPKNIMTGEGGMIVTDNPILAERCRLIRNHGEAIPNEEDKYLHDIIGYNFRLTEIQAAIGIEQLKKLDTLNNIRKENYEYLKNGIEEIMFRTRVKPQKITNTEYYPYTASFFSYGKAAICDILLRHSISVAEGIPRLLCDHPYYKNLEKVNVPEARILNNYYLGFFQIGWPNTTKEMQEILDVLKEVV
jgi:perosamine synthetase